MTFAQMHDSTAPPPSPIAEVVAAGVTHPNVKLTPYDFICEKQQHRL